ncbi:MAG TPA: UDP-3-O-acyl-N-acetylglucosamine deacetylase [Thiobacillaceae bacterium]|nr:UDP-3-O-acyl-N-acetylglucosamine deacetylase [Nitrospira sp.]HNA28407.1 UDP-3-O-acyl-N-acetylglucosamine deacetylase [Thiobacillaceae bacterium]HNA81659.1 UDP-3-O-acyl-N-acetylglucosamine deacetylase [Thiobacillaceae bacterium]HNF87888.1 UDP-3-O-acyl-N-acetylglucosamine deacetylase [Thiobacillaceae bacterium]HNH87835.1 UDP-3-O-acyl-N-acetylglucosamine deacetylase [Thiobacillaceae bacterium]
MIRQRTIKSLVRATGVGLHSGARVNLTLRPALANTGIIFRRTDLSEPKDFVIAPERVVDTRLCSALEGNGARVATVEHLLSALAGLGIDNLLIDLDGPEVPILDGSAAPFVYLLQSAGIEEQGMAKRFIRVKRRVRVEEGDKWAEFSPHEGYSLTFRIDFDHPVFRQSAKEMHIDLAKQSYVREVSRARTFGFMNEVEYLRSNGLALGGTLDNAIVMDEFRVLNSDGLRYADEFVKHKVLDAVGDLYLTGHPILGAFTAYKSGHGLNNRLLRTLMETTDAWEWAEFKDEAATPGALLDLFPLTA